MLSADYVSHVCYATHENFTIAKKSVLMGQSLTDVRILENSLLRFGLLTPLTVMKKNGRLIVVDGRKRLAAIRRLGFQGRLPRSLIHIPYEILSDRTDQILTAPSLTASQTLFQSVVRAFKAGVQPAHIARKFQISSRSVRDILTLDRLGAPIRQAFFDRLISFPQAAAYASQPDQSAQLSLFRKLGPFANPSEICEMSLQDKASRVERIAA